MKKLTFSEVRSTKLLAILDSLLSYRTPSKTAYDMITELKKVGQTTTVNFDDLVQAHYGKPEYENEFEYLFCKVLTAYYLVHLVYSHDRAKTEPKLSPAAEQGVLLLRNAQAILEEYVPEYSVYNYHGRGFLQYKPSGSDTVVNNLETVPQEDAFLVVKLLKVMSNKDDLTKLVDLAMALLEKTPKKGLRGLNHIDKAVYHAAIKQVKVTTHLFKVYRKHLAKTQKFANDWSLSLRDIAHTLAINLSLALKLLHQSEVIKVKATEVKQRRATTVQVRSTE